MKPLIQWTDDCQGKKDYDGHVLDVSTRYWPPGGGFHIYDTRAPERGFHLSDDPALKPSAHSSLILRHADGDEYETLIEQDFEANTQEEVQRAVEQWVQEKFDIAVAILKAAFAKMPSESENEVNGNG